MVGIRAYQLLRRPAVLIQPQDELDNGGDQPLGQLANDVHSAGGGVLFHIALGQMDLRHDLFVVALQGLLGIVCKEGQRLLGVVVEFLLHREANGDVAPLVHLAADDEAVHLGTQDEGLADGGADEMEEGVLVLGAALIQLCQIFIHGPQVDVHADVGLVIRPVGHQGGHDPVHGGDILQPDTVLAVSPFSFFHCERPFLSNMELSYQMNSENAMHT